jgi:hypothetical protein
MQRQKRSEADKDGNAFWGLIALGMFGVFLITIGVELYLKGFFK